MKQSYATLLIGLYATVLTLNGQTTLQLPLDPGRVNPGSSIKQTIDGDFLLSSYFPGPNLLDGGDANLTRFRMKEGILWSRDFSFNSPNIGSFVAEWPQESALLMTAFVLDSFYNKVLVKLDPQGNVLWSRRYGKPNDVSEVNIFNGKTLVLPTADGNALLAGGASQIASNNGVNDLFVGKIDPAGNIVWARNLCFSCLGLVDAALGGITTTSDGGLMVSGIMERGDGGPLNQTFEDVLLVKLNASGNVQWARTYNSPGSFQANDDRAFAVKELPNGNFVLAGAVENFIDNRSDGLLLQVNANGNIVSATAVGIAGADHTVTLLQLEALDANTVTVSGSTAQDTFPDVALELNFLAEIRLDGTVNWARQYYPEPLIGYGTAANAMQRLPSGGYAYLINYALFFDNLYPILLLTDNEGRTGCELPVALSTQNNLNYTSAVVPLTAEPLTFSENFPVTTVDFNGFNLDLPYPDLGPDQTACAPLNVPLDAADPSVDSYAWSTGATTPSIVAIQPGAYAVTITASEFCLTAADTVLIQESAGAPQAEITLDTAGFCTTGFVQLSAQAPDAESLRWSTGDTSTTIQVAQAGAYALLAQNGCGADTALLVLVLPDCDTTPILCPFIVPSAFTPDNDNINDFFSPIGECPEVERYLFRVFNRWGGLVFESNSPQERWNGQINEQPAASDVYAWYLQYEDTQRGAIREQGDVTLIR